jgi:ketosteroid isomerase-like protein
MTERLALARRGLEAWRAGDFETLEQILAPAVEWNWWEPGDWDCHGRDDVMRTFRERHAQGFGRGPLDLREVGDDAIVAVSHPRQIGGPEWPEETATLIRFRGGKVVSMRDYPTEAEALAAL